jgi:dipeptidyl aminopeptidase/acylaminoacyl peptidase
MFVLAGSVTAAAQEVQPLPVGSLEFSKPATVTRLDMGQLKGEPSRLVWSADGAQFYVQTIEGGFGRPEATLHHYLFDAATGQKSDLTAEPDWAASTWAVKSHRDAPDVPGHQIALESAPKQVRTTSVPRGGDLARGGLSAGQGTTSDDAVMAANNQMNVMIHTMKLKGETIGEFETVIVPGLTFAWAPAGAQAIAFANKDGKLFVMNAEKKKQEIKNTKDAVLPAWSADGSRLAWLRKDGRRHYELLTVDVKR